MKTISILLTKEERKKLKKLHNMSGDYRSERALAVLHCADGFRPSMIATMLQRSSQSICLWLKAYKRNGIDGLSRENSAGRPKNFEPGRIENYIKKFPYSFGLRGKFWTVNSIRAQYEKDSGVKVSRFTIIRALKDAGYKAARKKNRFTNSRVGTSLAKSKLEKTINEIQKNLSSDECEVICLDHDRKCLEVSQIRYWVKTAQPFFPEKLNENEFNREFLGIRLKDTSYIIEKVSRRKKRKSAEEDNGDYGE